jgi:hypothetical protein
MTNMAVPFAWPVKWHTLQWIRRHTLQTRLERSLDPAMSNLPVLSTLVACAVAACICVVAAAGKYSLFHKAVDKKYTGHIVETLVAKSAQHCSMKCLASSSCMACNWDAATGSCEISTQHATITDAPGIVMYTSKPLSKFKIT